MCDLSEFFEANPRSRRLRDFEADELAELEQFGLPPDLLNFLTTEGLATYHDDFFYTTLPQYHFAAFKDWGLSEKQYFAFLRTAFGNTFFYNKKNGKIFQLNPLSGYLTKSNFDFCTYLNRPLTMDFMLEACYFDMYKKHIEAPAAPDEVYGLFPALPLGGSFETSAYKAVQLNEHLSFLAQLFGHKVRKL